jgi:type II secretory pathway component PulK
MMMREVMVMMMVMVMVMMVMEQWCLKNNSDCFRLVS